MPSTSQTNPAPTVFREKKTDVFTLPELAYSSSCKITQHPTVRSQCDADQSQTNSMIREPRKQTPSYCKSVLFAKNTTQVRNPSPARSQLQNPAVKPTVAPNSIESRNPNNQSPKQQQKPAAAPNSIESRDPNNQSPKQQQTTAAAPNSTESQQSIEGLRNLEQPRHVLHQPQNRAQNESLCTERSIAPLPKQRDNTVTLDSMHDRNECRWSESAHRAPAGWNTT